MALIAFSPLLAWIILNKVKPGSSFLPFLLLPLIFFLLLATYEVLRYRLLNVDRIFSHAFIYALLSLLVISSYALLVSGSILLFGDAIPLENPLFVGVLVFILALGFNPLHARLQSGVDKVYFRDQVNFQERLGEFGRQLSQAGDTQAILNLIRQNVEAVLFPHPLHIFLVDVHGTQYLASPDESGRPSSDLMFPANSELVKYLSRQRKPIFLGERTAPPADLQPERARLSLLGAHLLIPLLGSDQLIGWLGLGLRRSGEPYRLESVAYLESLALQAALALEHLHILANLKLHLQEMDIITRVATGINVTQAFDDLLEMFFAQTNHLVPTKDFRITLMDDSGTLLHHVFYLENDDRVVSQENQILSLHQGLEIEVVRGGQPIVTEDYQAECHRRGQLPDARGIFAWLGVPLNAGAETIGVVSLGSRDPTILFTSQQVELLQAIANLVAGAIVKVRLLEEMELRARHLTMLNDLARSLTSTLELDPLLERILQSAVEILGCESGSLLLVDENTGESIFAVAVGPVGGDLIGQRLPPGVGLVGKAVKTGQSIIQNNVRCSEEWYNADEQTGYSTKDMLVVPMLVKERVIGVLEVLNKCDNSPFIEADLELLSGFAGQAAIAIENARLYTLTDKALAERVDELSVMQVIDRDLNASLDLERALRITLEWAVRQSKADAGLVGILEEEVLHVMASQGYSSEMLASSNSHLANDIPSIQEAIQSGLLQSNGMQSSSLLPDARSQVVVPIQRESSVIAVILLESTEPAGLSDQILGFLQRLSNHAAIAISNAQLYAAIQTANVAKSQFVSLAAHELKNPLTSIKGYTDLLVGGAVGAVSEGQSRFLATIRSNADRMSTLVSDLQDISRIEAGQLRLQFATVGLNDAIEEVIHTLRKQIEDKDQTLEIELAPDLLTIWCDHSRLVQVLMNLVSNAHKYTQKGGRITVVAEQVPNQWDVEGVAQVVHVSVMDNGIGISPEDQRKLFQQFFRSEDPKVREVTGTGLGLTITKNLVEMQGGRIWFESNLNQGTTFHFTIPVAETN